MNISVNEMYKTYRAGVEPAADAGCFAARRELQRQQSVLQLCALRAD